MKVVRRINNNVVLVRAGRKQMILTGKGVGFSAVPGGVVDEALVQHRYVMESDQDAERMAPLFAEIPLDILYACEEAVASAAQQLQKQLPETLAITLADHVHTAARREAVHHPWEWEIKHLYPAEIAAARQALGIIRQKTGLQFEETEVYFLALHFVNAQINTTDDFYAIEMTKLILKILNIIQYHFHLEISQESIAFSRFVTHLRFYLVRYIEHSFDNAMNDEILLAIKQAYPEGYACAGKIAAYLEAVYRRPTSESEKMYLTLHIRRVLEDSRET